jgi:hypothetical protein
VYKKIVTPMMYASWLQDPAVFRRGLPDLSAATSPHFK